MCSTLRPSRCGTSTSAPWQRSTCPITLAAGPWPSTERVWRMTELAERYRENHARLLAARERLRQAVDAGTATDAERKRLKTLDELLTPVKGTAVDAHGKVVEV